MSGKRPSHGSSRSGSAPTSSDLQPPVPNYRPSSDGTIFSNSPASPFSETKIFEAARERERGWNNSFAAQAASPLYDAMKDPHCAYTKSEQFAQHVDKWRKNYEDFATKEPHRARQEPKPPASPPNHTQSSHNIIVSSSHDLSQISSSASSFLDGLMPIEELSIGSPSWEQSFAKACTKLHSLWNDLHIPDHERRHFAELFLDFPSPENYPYVEDEVSALTEQKARILAVLRVAEHREQLLTDLTSLCASSFSSSSESILIPSDVIQSAATLVLMLRTATLEAVEAIDHWRDCLTLPRPFLWRGTNYLLKIRQDAAQLASEFPRLFESLHLSSITSANDSVANPLFLPAASFRSISSPQRRKTYQPPPSASSSSSISVTPAASAAAAAEASSTPQRPHSAASSQQRSRMASSSSSSSSLRPSRAVEAAVRRNRSPSPKPNSGGGSSGLIAIPDYQTEERLKHAVAAIKHELEAFDHSLKHKKKPSDDDSPPSSPEFNGASVPVSVLSQRMLQRRALTHSAPVAVSIVQRSVSPSKFHLGERLQTPAAGSRRPGRQ